MFNSPFRFFLLLTLAFATASCDPKKDDEDKKPSQETKELSTDDIEVKEDGLAYVKGQEQPYSGAIFQRFSDDTPRYFAFYVDGQLHGAEMRWYRTGILRHSYDYERGEKIRHRQWFENGNRKIDAMMKDGVALGRHVTWFEDGRERFVGNFLEGLIWHGHIKDFGEDGKVKWDAIFDNGRYVSGIYPESEKQRLIDAGLLKKEEE